MYILKDLIGAVLSRFSNSQTLLLKAATFPRFYKWRNLHRGLDIIDGAPREKRNRLFEYIKNDQNLDGAAITYFEFGVHEGASILWWTENNKDPDSVFLGFDSFTGLPEDWMPGRSKGHFSTGGKIPETEDPRVQFVKGWFHNTLANHVTPLKSLRRRIIHMDADLYRSTIYPLTIIGPHLKENDIIIFDEFADTIHEFRAFEDYSDIFDVDLKLIAATRGFMQVAFKLHFR